MPSTWTALEAVFGAGSPNLRTSIVRELDVRLFGYLVLPAVRHSDRKRHERTAKDRNGQLARRCVMRSLTMVVSNSSGVTAATSRRPLSISLSLARVRFGTTQARTGRGSIRTS